MKNFAAEIDTAIEDAIFAEVEILNGKATQIAECAAAAVGGEMMIEGAVVQIPDKNGRPHYYTYRWDNSRDFAFDTSLLPVGKSKAKEIAAEWSLAHGYISFEDFMDASNAEYKNIRKLYLEHGGWTARDYDKQLLEEMALAACAITPDAFEAAVAAEIENANAKPRNFAITLPKDDFSETAIENVKAIVASKATLIKKALNVGTVEIKISDGDLKFDRFAGETKIEEMQAASEFISKIGELAKKQKRVTAKEREVENERYAFRCFLLRLGMIGAEYKTARKILLKNLSGNCAFKSGSRGGKS